MRNRHQFEVEALEELFLDQLEFKVRAVILLLSVGYFEGVDIVDHLQRLTRLGEMNLACLRSYVPKK